MCSYSFAPTQEHGRMYAHILAARNRLHGLINSHDTPACIRKRVLGLDLLDRKRIECMYIYVREYIAM